MFGRTSYVHGDPDRIDDLITYAQTVVKPATDELAGNQGLGMWVNRTTGDALVMTVWNNQSSMLDSEQAVAPLRDDGAGIIGGAAEVDRCEAALLDGVAPHRPGHFMRLQRMFCEPGLIDSHVDWARRNVLAKLCGLDGYISYVLAVDRLAGLMVTQSTFVDAASAAASMTAMAPVRELAANRGIAIEREVDFEVAIVGIRAPIVLLPEQRMVDVTDTIETAAHR